jgi:16S rRNA (guanine966-N2)-methyltransferase
MVLKQPRGRGTRPTASRLREALFAMLEAADADLTEVLDLYAGTGALGIEALSRGAERCTFVEADTRAAAVLRENVERVGMREQGTTIVAQVGRWRPPQGTAYTLVVADPPYDDAAAWQAIDETLREALAPHALVAVEHAARVVAPDELAGLPRWRDRRQGDGAVAIYRAGGKAA